ncbi:MAG TPA: tripartite tricarboxylate transporter TctB family protein [Trueperaceae bacterium]
MTSRQDFYTALVLIVFSGAVVFESLRMPVFEQRGGTMLTAPGLVPGALGIILALCGLILLVRSLLARKPHESRNLEAESVEEGTPAAWSRLITMAVLSIGYAGGLVGWLPFWMATFIFVSLSVAIFEWNPRNPPGKRYRLLGFALVEGLLAGLAVSYIFEQIFLVRLP